MTPETKSADELPPNVPPLILLAAGKSSRCGIAKGLIEVGGQTVLETHLNLFMQCGGRDALIMFGADAADYLKTFSWLSLGKTSAYRQSKLNVAAFQISHGEPHLTPTLLEALAIVHQTRGEGACYFSPIDAVIGDGSLYQKLLDALTSKADVAVPQYGTRGGHPVLLSSQACETIRSHAKRIERIDHFIRSDLRRIFLPVQDKSVLNNLNTLFDWQAFSSGETAKM